MIKIITCSFLGHGTVYDSAVDGLLSACIKRLVRQNDEVTFLFYRNGAFYDRCLYAALAARQHNPQKKIVIACIAGARWEQPCFPDWLIDRVIETPPEIAALGDQNPLALFRQTERWMLRQSTHLIAYLYPGLRDPQSRLLAFAKKCGLTVCDVTSQETAAFIAQSVEELPQKERFVVRQRYEGIMRKETGRLLGLTVSEVQRVLRTALGLLRRALEEREACGPAPMSCGVFNLGPATPEGLKRFEDIVLFLLDRYPIRRFEISSEYCYSQYARVLVEIAEEWPNEPIQLVAIAHRDEALVPCCHAVEHIDLQLKRASSWPLRKAKAIIDRTDFCICMAQGVFLTESIKNYLQQKANNVAFGVDGKLWEHRP